MDESNCLKCYNRTNKKNEKNNVKYTSSNILK